jgi:competence protein ComEC
VRRALLTASERLPPDQRGLVPGAAIGDTSRVPADLDEAMRLVGLTHVTAVSGAHFTIVGAAVLGLVAAAGAPRVVRAGALAVAMAGFVVLVHPTPSVLRAAAMGAVGVSALVLGRPARAVPALAATVVTLLVVDPWLASNVGFTLSVVATAGIVLLSRPLGASLSGLMGERAGRVVAVPLAAQLACGPVVVLLAPALPTYAVPANVVVAPAIVPATILGVLAALVAPWWTWGGQVLAQGSGWATWWLASVARLFAGLPGAQVPWPSGPWGPVLLAVATAGVVLALLRLRRPDDRT